MFAQWSKKLVKEVAIPPNGPELAMSETSPLSTRRVKGDKKSPLISPAAQEVADFINAAIPVLPTDSSTPAELEKIGATLNAWMFSPSQLPLDYYKNLQCRIALKLKVRRTN